MSEGVICTIYLARHGESEANINRTVQGHIDSPLTNKGKEQAKELAEVFKDVNLTAVYSSDLKRAEETAKIVAESKGLGVKTFDELREKFFGDFEGKPHKEYVEVLKEEFDRFDNELNTDERWDHKAHPSMESDRELLDRFLKKMREIASAHLGEDILVVAHRYAIRMFLLSLGIGEHEDLRAGALKTGGWVIIESDGQSFSVKEVNGAETQ